jgi:DNA-binding XRE family transcriptional regulator
MSKPEGIYMSADYRASRYGSGELVDDASIKFLTVQYPFEHIGPKALFGYSGLAILRDGTPMGTWIRETLRGPADVFDESMALLRERLNRDVAPLKAPLQISLLVALGASRYIASHSNVRNPGQPFVYKCQKLTQPIAFAHGSGSTSVEASADVTLLKAQLNVKPRTPLDHMKLLAATNRRAAEKESTVSPFCHVAYLNGDEQTQPEARVFTEPGEAPLPFEIPIVFNGLDTTDMPREFHQHAQAVLRGEAPEMGRRIRRLRKERGMSQATLAKRARLTRLYITRLEAGRQDPSLSTISAVARALGVPVTALLE